MKNLLLISSLFMAFSATMFGQTCSESQAQQHIENSELKILFRNGGDMFWDGIGYASYQVPYSYNQPSPSTYFAAGVWMGGYDDGGNLCLAAQTYRSQGNDYWAGPLDDSIGQVINNGCTDFDYIWKVERWAIERHITDYNLNNQINGSVDPSLLRWPARGNPHFAQEMGFALPNQDLAPFYDQNNNAIYEPMLGDYPVFEHGNPNAIAAEILWSVFNDIGNLHTQSNGLPLRIEVQQTAYVFDCINDPVLNKTLFLKHKVINKNPLPFYDYYYGLWSDPDMGCNNDDYVGSIPSKNTIYSYNQDNNDDNPCGTAGILGYGANPPVQAMTFLNQSMAHAMYYVNTQGPVGDPTSALGYYRLMDGYFSDGTHLTSGGNGYNPNNPSAILADHIFPANPNDPQGWSMVSENLSGLDQRTIGSIFKDTLMPGETFTVDIAFSYHRDLDSSNLQNVNLMYQQIDAVQQFYDAGFPTPSCSQPLLCTANCVYPGDANNNGVANDFDILEMGLVYGQNAATRAVIGDNWGPHMPPSPITNAYQDANGNNLVEALDLDANTTNFMELHALYTGAAEGFNTQGSELNFERVYSNFFLFQLDTIPQLNRNFSLDVNFADSLNQITDLYALTFRIAYDENAVVQHVLNNPNTVYGSTELDAGWIDDDNAPTFARHQNLPGKMHYVTTRLDQTNITGGGNLGRLAFRIAPYAPVNADTMYTQICFEDFKAIRADGTTIPIGAQCITVMYKDTNFIGTTVRQLQASAPQVAIYPNPAQDYVNIDLGDARAASIQFYNLLGELVHEQSNATGLVEIQNQALTQGVYMIVLHFENGSRSTHKVVFGAR